MHWDNPEGWYGEGGFPGDLDSKESACNTRDLGWEDPLEKEMATHSSILAWKIPWTEDMSEQKVGQD